MTALGFTVLISTDEFFVLVFFKHNKTFFFFFQQVLKHIVKWKFMDFTLKNETGPMSNNHFNLFPKNEQSQKHGIIMCNPKNLEISVKINRCLFFLMFLFVLIYKYKINFLV